MSGGWQGRDLGGGGLQAANLALAARLKRRPRAYALLALAPLGLHRTYLESPRGAWGWRIACALAVVIVMWQPALAWPALVALAVAIVADGIWIDGRVTALNKSIRRAVYLGQGAAPPPGYAGRNPAADAGRAPSFAEQERLLRDLARRRPPHGPG